jgi:probable blue pigment (indigoidine) exporter
VSSRPTGLAALIAIIWGLCFVLIQASLPSPAPLLLAASRALIGGGVLAAWVALRGRQPVGRRRDAGLAVPHLGRPALPSIPLLIALALTNAALALGAMYLAAGRAEAAIASILAGGQPLVLAAAGWALFGERLSRVAVSGLAVAMAGVVVVATTSSGATSPDGVALALLATAAPAAGTVLMRKLAPAVDLLVTTSAQFLLGGAILLAVSALFEPWGAVSWSPAMLPGLLVLGVLGTGLAYVAWFWLFDRVSLVRLGAALFLVPVVGMVAAIVTGDRPAPVALAGIAGVLVGIGIVSVGGASAPSGEEPVRQTA